MLECTREASCSEHWLMYFVVNNTGDVVEVLNGRAETAPNLPSATRAVRRLGGEMSRDMSTTDVPRDFLWLMPRV